MIWISPQLVRRGSPAPSLPLVEASSSWFSILLAARTESTEAVWDAKGCGSSWGCTLQSVTSLILAGYPFAGNVNLQFLVYYSYIFSFYLSRSPVKSKNYASCAILLRKESCSWTKISNISLETKVVVWLENGMSTVNNSFVRQILLGSTAYT